MTVQLRNAIQSSPAPNRRAWRRGSAAGGRRPSSPGPGPLRGAAQPWQALFAESSRVPPAPAGVGRMGRGGRQVVGETAQQY